MTAVQTVDHAQTRAGIAGGSRSGPHVGGDPHALLLSVHMPKTAGTSFSNVLRAQFGTRYRADYGDLPMQSSALCRNLHALLAARRRHRQVVPDIACVHGHFLPTKYNAASDNRGTRFVTWLRDPVQRLASHYHYWRRDYDGSDPAQPLRNRMLREAWTFERFALGRELRNVYRQYLWRFDPRRFDFIGITENYAEDLALFAGSYLDGDAELSSDLVNPERSEALYRVDAGLQRRIEQHHAEDVALYRWAAARRG